jgi:colanic acid/amylovoran biosynthesis glycosyltransferase
VIFEGAVNQDCVRQYFSGADVFVLASFAEGIPVALMEAMACEIPCVSTRITGIPELIRDGIDGLLVSPSDERELAGAIASLIDDPLFRRQIGKAGRARVADQFEMDRNVKQLSNLFCEHIRAQRPAQQAT